MIKIILTIFLILLPINGCEEVKVKEMPSDKMPKSKIEIASWYDYDLNASDQKCRSLDCYSMTNDTCASRDYVRGTILSVRATESGKIITCRVNDYGPELGTGRAIDLSSHAFKQLADLKIGLINVTIKQYGN